MKITEFRFAFYSKLQLPPLVCSAKVGLELGFEVRGVGFT